MDLRKKEPDEKFCHECGEAIRAKAEICPKCGVRQPGLEDHLHSEVRRAGKYFEGVVFGPEDRKRGIAVFLAAFGGLFGLHKFYLRQYVQGVLYCAFSWTLIPMVLGIIEALNMAFMTDEYFAQVAKTRRL